MKWEVGSGKWERPHPAACGRRPSPNRWERGWMLTDAGEDDEGACLGKALTPPRRCGGDRHPQAGTRLKGEGRDAGDAGGNEEW